MTEEGGESKAVVFYHGEAKPLAKYGESKVVRVVADRIMALDSRKEKLNRMEAMMVAQCAVANRLSPFPPSSELVSWVKVLGNGERRLTITRGRDGSLKRAKENMAKVGTHMEPPRFRRIVDAVERRDRHVPPDALAYEAEVADYLSNQAYYASLRDLKDSGITGLSAIELIGKPPADYGLGIVTADEIENLEWAHNSKGERTFKLDVKYNHEERCKKRALIAALRVRWLADEAEEREAEDIGSVEDYVIDGEWLDVTPPAITSGEERQERARQGREALYGADEQPAPDRKKPAYWPRAVIHELITLRIAQNDYDAAGLLALSKFDGTVGVKDAVAYGRRYRAGRDEGKGTSESAEKAWKEYKELLKGG